MQSLKFGFTRDILTRYEECLKEVCNFNSQSFKSESNQNYDITPSFSDLVRKCITNQDKKGEKDRANSAETDDFESFNIRTVTMADINPRF